MGVALCASVVLPDFPTTTSKMKFSDEETKLAIRRLQSDAQAAAGEEGSHLGHWEAFKCSMHNWKTWLFVVGYMVRYHLPPFILDAQLTPRQAVVGSSTLSYFYPTLVSGLGYESTTAQYMTIPIFGVAFVVTGITGIFADRYSKCRGLILTGWMTVAMLCSIIICAVYDFKARYALLVIMASGLWACNGLSLSYASISFGDMQKETKAVSLAFINAMGNLAQIYGAYLFPSDDEPKYIMGFGVISAMCFTGVVSYFALYYFLRRQEKGRAGRDM